MKRQKRNVPEFSPPESNFIERVHKKNKEISEKDLRSLQYLKKDFFQNIFSDYVYEINFPKDSQLLQVCSLSLSTNKNSKYRSHIYTITFPPSLKNIESFAFKGCTFLNEITFLKNDKNINNLENLKDDAFSGTIIESISIPSKIKTIGSRCFPSTLQKIELEKGAPSLQRVDSRAFSNLQIESFIMPVDITPFIQNKNIFIGCRNLKTITFDKYANKDQKITIDEENEEKEITAQKNQFKEKIQKWAKEFDNEKENPGIEPTHDLANNLLLSQTKIEKLDVFSTNLNIFYFYNTPNLKKIAIKNENGRFIKNKGAVYTNDMKKLIIAERNIKDATINSNCQMIANYALNIPTLKNVSFEDDSKLQEISFFAFSESLIKNLVLPNTIDRIDYGAFYKCTKLESINIPPLLNTIDYATFAHSRLTEITIPKSVCRIEYGSFYHCKNLQKVSFEKNSNLTVIEDFAFAFTKLKYLYIPKSVKKVGNLFFIYNGKPRTIYYEKKISKLDDCQFVGEYNNFDFSYYNRFINDIDTFSIKIKKLNFIDNDIFSIFYDKDEFKNENGCIYTNDMEQLIDAERNIKEIKINSNCQVISKNALNIKSLRKVAFDKGSKLTTIKNFAFSESQIKTIRLPKKVKSMCNGAFYKCTKLESFIIPPLVEQLDTSVFSYTNLTEITILKNIEIIRYGCFFHCHNLAKVNFEKGPKLIEIEDYAFAFTKLETFIVPKSVERIGNYCFANCGSLKAVIFEGGYCSIGEDCYTGTQVQSYRFISEDNQLNDIKMHSKLVKKVKIEKTDDFNDLYNRYDDVFTNENGVIYSKDMKQLADAERNINEIKINSKCQVISNYALSIESLKKVTFEDNSELNKISSFAFANSQIKALVIPNSVTNIEEYVFYNCTKLESINLPPNINVLNQITFSYTKITEITIPKSVTSINFGCFYRCSNLEKVTFDKDSNVTNLEPFAFAFTKIKTFSLPKSVKIIDDYCFLECKNLKSITVPVDSRLEKLGSEFLAGTQVKSFELPKNVESFDFSSTVVEKVPFSKKSSISLICNFMKSQIQQISIPSSVVEIGVKAFFECKNLQEVTIINIKESKLQTIHREAFLNCTSLTKFEIPKTVQRIDNYSFKNCEKCNAQFELVNNENIFIGKNAFENSGVTKFEIECKRIEVQNFAFIDCKNLTEFSVKVTEKCKLKSSSFQNCTALTTVAISPDVKEINIEDCCFMNSGIQSFEVPVNLKKIQKSCFKKCANLSQVTFKDKSKITCFDNEAFSESGIKSISIPSKTQTINDSCFLKCTKLKKISFSKNLEKCSLKEKAFAISAISKLNIPSSISQIERSCFEGCKYLKEVIFSDDLQFNNIEERVFQSTGLESLTLPSKIQYIGKSAFKNCKQLKSVTFQANRACVSLNAFTDCKSLSEVNCNSTVVIEPVTPDNIPILVTINQKQIEKAIIDAFFVDPEPCYEPFCQFDLNYTLLINKKYHFNQPFNWTFRLITNTNKIDRKIKMSELFDDMIYIKDQIECGKPNKNLFRISEFIEGGYYQNFRKNLVGCNLEIENIVISKEAETIEINALRFSKIKKVEFEDGSKLKEIKSCAFKDLEIEEITIPDSVVVIEKEAFANCRSLKKVNISSSSKLERIEESAFERTSIESILFPPSLTDIGDYAFFNCIKLKTVDNQSNRINFGSHSFAYSSIKKISFPKNSTFNESSFKYCRKLSQLTFLEEPDEIYFGEESFAFTDLDKIKIKNSAHIQPNAFIFCQSMKSINLTKSSEFFNNSFSYSGFNALICSIALKTMLKGNKIDINDYFDGLFSSSVDKMSLSLSLPDKNKHSLFLNHKCLVEDETLVYADMIDNVSLYEKLPSKNKDVEIKKNEVLRVPSNVKRLNFQPMTHIKKINWGSNSSIEDLGPEGFFSYYNLIEITIPSTVTSVSPHLFEHCHYLKTVQFNEDSKLTEISPFCFAHTKIETVQLPKSVQIIGESAFYGNKYLKEVAFEGEIIKNNAFAETGIIEFKLPDNTKTIESNAFRDCHSLKKFEIDINKSKLEEIGSYAFSETSIEEINIPSKINRIRKGTFNGCQSLMKVNISSKSKLKRIDRYSFSCNLRLKSINLPKSVLKISPKSFINTPLLETLMNESNERYEVLEDQTIYNKNKNKLIFVPRTIQEYKIKNTCKTIGSGSFCGSKLENIIFPEDSIEIIENDAFSHCTSLKNITIPKSVSKLGEGVFTGCENLENVEFSEGTTLTDIPNFCFSFSGLKSIKLPDSLKRISRTCFDFCYNLESITLHGYRIDGKCDQFPYIDKLIQKSSESKSNSEQNKINEESTDEDKNKSKPKKKTNLKTESEKEPATIIVADKNKNKYHICDNTLYYVDLFDNSYLFEKSAKGSKRSAIKDNEILHIPFFVEKINIPLISHIKRIDWGINSNVIDLGPARHFSYYNLIDFTIPNTVTTVSPHLFEHCHFLKIIKFEKESKLTEISPFCFAHTRIEKILLPGSVKVIGESAFYDNKYLQKVVFVGEIIKSNAFAETGITEFKLPNSTKTIESNAFRDCHSLKKFEIDINKSKLEEIGSYAFSETSIEEINIPSKINRICKGTFNGCQSLMKVNISSKSKLKRIDRYSFSCNLRLKFINLPKSVLKISSKSFINTPLLKAIMTESNKKYKIQEDQSIYSKDKNKLIFVPRTIQEYTIKNTCKTIGSGSFCGSKLENIIFPEDSIEIIENDAFSHCTSLKNITIPKSVTKLGEGVFTGCENLENVEFSEGTTLTDIPNFCFSFSGIKSIKLPDSLKRISRTCFDFCYNLESITLHGYRIDGNCNFFSYIDNLIKKSSESNSNSEHNKINEESTNETENKSEDKNATESNKKDETSDKKAENENESSEIIITDKNKNKYHICDNTLYYVDLFDNSRLYVKPEKLPSEADIKDNEILHIPFFVEKINIPLISHIKRIDWGINSNVIDLGPARHFSYYNLIDFTIPNTVTTVSPHLFEHCHFLKIIKFEKESKLTEISPFCFAHTRIEEVQLPESVQIIGESAFYDNKHLQKVTFMGEIIKSNAFGETGITEFKLPNSTKTIESNAFRDCHSLKKFEIDINKSKLEEIGSYAFSETSIEEINIPSKINRIHKGTFNGCQSLVKVNISSKSKLKRIDRYSFSCNLRLKSINLPKSVLKISPKSFINTPLLETLMNESNERYEVFEDQTIYNKNKNKLIFVPRTIQEYKIKNTCKIIGSGSFCGSKLENIIFPEDSIEIIENDSFSHCISLKSVTIPKSVSKLGEGVFTGCENLENVEFSEGTTLTDIPKFCFSFSGLKSINLPESIRNIQHSSFYFCQNLKTVNLNTSKVEYIGEYAFSATGIEKVLFPPTIRFVSSHAFDDIKTLDMIDLSKVSNIEPVSFIHKNQSNNKKDEHQEEQEEEKVETNTPVIRPPSVDINEGSHFIRHSEPTQDDQNQTNISSTNNNLIHSSRQTKRPTIIKPKVGQNNKVHLVSTLNDNKVYPGPFNRPSPIRKSRLPNLSDNSTQQQQPNNENSQTVQSNSLISNVEKGTCLICKTAFSNSSVKKFKLNTSFCWFDFFDKCKEINEIRFNENVQCLVKRTTKEEYNDNNHFGGQYYKVKKLKWNNISYVPVLSNELISSFSVHEKVEKLNEYNFSHCYNLKKVNFEENCIIKSIPKCTFAFCSLEAISIPDSVTIIESSAFLSCNNLQKVTFSPNSKLKIIKECAFSRCKKLSSINIPNQIEIIPKNCFSSTGLTSIEIPSSVKKINSFAFSDCKKLKKVVFNNGLIEIGENSFVNDNLLKIIELPDSLKTIKSCSFLNCTSLKRVNTTDETELIEIYEGAFENTQIEKLKVNQSATKLCDLSKVPNLRKILFSKGQPTYFIQKKDGTIYEKTDEFNKYKTSDQEISSIEEEMKNIYNKLFSHTACYYIDSFDKYMKYNCRYDKNDIYKILMSKIQEKEKSALRLVFAPKNLETLKIAENCLSMNSSILNNMKNLTTIEYEKGLTNVISYLPNYCNHLCSGVLNQINTVRIMSRFVALQEGVFSHFESLQVVEFGDATRILIIPKNAFLGCKNLQKISIPTLCFTIEEAAFKDCSSLESVVFKSNKNLKYIRKEAFCNCSSLTSVEIPTSVSVICEGAFMNCEKLEKAEFKNCKDFESLEAIEKYAFKNCTSLISFNLPKSCIFVGPACFMNCKALESFQYKGDKLMSIQSRSFLNCSSLKKIEMVNLYYNNHQEFKEDEKMFTFSINSEAFMNCTSLIKVVFEDNSKEMETIKFDKDNNPVFSYPSYEKHNHTDKEKKYFMNKRQLIHKNAFCNCTSLESARFFLGNLESIQEKAFMNCKALKTIEINSQFWKYMFTERLDLNAFEGTPQKLKLKVFNKGTEIENNPYSLINKIEKKKYDFSISSIKLFKEHLSLLNQSFFDQYNEEEEQNVKRIKIKSTIINSFDGPRFSLYRRYGVHNKNYCNPGPASYSVARFPEAYKSSYRATYIGLKISSQSVFNVKSCTSYSYNIRFPEIFSGRKIRLGSTYQGFGSLYYGLKYQSWGEYHNIERFPFEGPSFTLKGRPSGTTFLDDIIKSNYAPGPGAYDVKRYPIDKRQSITITSLPPQKFSKKGKGKKIVVHRPSPTSYKMYDFVLNKELLKWVEAGTSDESKIPVPFENIPKTYLYGRKYFNEKNSKLNKSIVRFDNSDDEDEDENMNEQVVSNPDGKNFCLIAFKYNPEKSLSKTPKRYYANKLSYLDGSFVEWEQVDRKPIKKTKKKKTKKEEKKKNKNESSKNKKSKKVKEPSIYPVPCKVKNPICKSSKRFFKKYVSSLNKKLLEWPEDKKQIKLQLIDPFEVYRQKFMHIKHFKDKLPVLNPFFINNEYPEEKEEEIKDEVTQKDQYYLLIFKYKKSRSATKSPKRYYTNFLSTLNKSFLEWTVPESKNLFSNSEKYKFSRLNCFPYYSSKFTLHFRHIVFDKDEVPALEYHETTIGEGPKCCLSSRFKHSFDQMPSTHALYSLKRFYTAESPMVSIHIKSYQGHGPTYKIHEQK